MRKDKVPTFRALVTLLHAGRKKTKCLGKQFYDRIRSWTEAECELGVAKLESNLNAEHQPNSVSSSVVTLVTILSSETATAGASVTSMRVGAFCSVFARISDSTFVYVYKRKH